MSLTKWKNDVFEIAAIFFPSLQHHKKKKKKKKKKKNLLHMIDVITRFLRAGMLKMAWKIILEKSRTYCGKKKSNMFSKLYIGDQLKGKKLSQSTPISKPQNKFFYQVGSFLQWVWKTQTSLLFHSHLPDKRFWLDTSLFLFLFFWNSIFRTFFPIIWECLFRK